MATLDGTWLPGIGDPSPMGWFTVAAYIGAAYACRRAAPRDPGGRAPQPASRHRFWWSLALIMALLGLNKQLDLQTAFTEIGRAVAVQGGWYEQRHTVQIAFIGLVGLLGTAALGLLAWLSWPLSPGRALSLGGLVFLGSFVVIRAASFHHVDLFINDTLFGLRWNWIVELSGIALVAAGAVREGRERPGRREGPAVRGRSEPPPQAQPPTRQRRPAGDDRPVISRNDPRSQRH